MEKIVFTLFVFSLTCLVGLFVLKEIERRRGRSLGFSLWLGNFDNYFAPKISTFFFFFRGEGEGSLKYQLKLVFQRIKNSAFNFLNNLQKKYNTFKESSRGQYPLKNNGTNSDFLKQVSEYRNGNEGRSEENVEKETETLK